MYRDTTPSLYFNFSNPHMGSHEGEHDFVFRGHYSNTPEPYTGRQLEWTGSVVAYGHKHGYKRSVWDKFPTDVPYDLKSHIEPDIFKRIFGPINEEIDAENARLKKGAVCGKNYSFFMFMFWAELNTNGPGMLWTLLCCPLTCGNSFQCCNRTSCCQFQNSPERLATLLRHSIALLPPGFEIIITSGSFSINFGIRNLFPFFFIFVLRNEYWGCYTCLWSSRRCATHSTGSPTCCENGRCWFSVRSTITITESPAHVARGSSTVGNSS